MRPPTINGGKDRPNIVFLRRSYGHHNMELRTAGEMCSDNSILDGCSLHMGDEHWGTEQFAQ